ncbi:hypothetical protein PS2_006979 [Malus domestica]
MTLGNGDDCPWIYAGDFNGLLWAHEKKGGSPWSITRIRHLHNFMDSNCLIDIGYKGPSFTWVKIEDGIGSDHCLIILYLEPKKAKSKKLFKFESSWAIEPDCDVVKQGWDKGRGVLGHTRWQSSLGHCGRHLITWSKEKFPNNSIKIRELLAELSNIQDSNDSCNFREFEIMPT